MRFSYKFMSYRKPALLLSLALFVLSLLLIVFRGLNLGIDFTGGNVVQVEFTDRPDVGEVRSTITSAVSSGAMIQNFGDKGIIIRTNEDTEESRKNLVAALTERWGANGMTVVGFEKVGPVVGRELRNQAVIGLSIALLAILVYITLRFQFRFAVVSVVPLVHDAVLTLGFFSLSQMEISSSFIAAILTIVGYSLNNTIIILDRIRENWKNRGDIVTLVDTSINQTLSRTINTTLTTVLPVIALCIWGGPVLAAFSIAMLVGIVVG
ncbi:MAG: protein translocase subunit SecF, partial [Synergistaceae bacterium]|nr:protein translocase subunit SecF [Synergistaceae bacterium]